MATNHDDNLRIGQGEVLREKLQRASDRDIRDEYRYRLRQEPPTTMSRDRMIGAIVAEVDRSGDGPESLKDMLRF
jgi:hypothetical protein